MAKNDVEKPNKRNIEKLFRELSGYQNAIDTSCPSKVVYEKADKRVDELYAKLTSSGPYAHAVAVRDLARKDYDEEREKLKEELSKIRRLYYARGLTPLVLKKIEKFVDKLNNS